MYISTKLRERLSEREHPLLVVANARLVLPDTGLLYFAVDNTQSASDPGVQAYKAKLQELCEASPSATIPVPYNLIKLQDCLQALARPAPTESEPTLHQELRQRYRGSQQALQYLQLEDAAEVYRASLSADDVFEEVEFLSYIQFLHIQGAITHANAGDPLILDPFWLLRTLAAVIRDPQLQPRAVDVQLSPSLFRLLYLEGDDGLSNMGAENLCDEMYRRVGCGSHSSTLAGAGRPRPPTGGGHNVEGDEIAGGCRVTLGFDVMLV